MSLEKAIEANTAAVLALISAIGSRAVDNLPATPRSNDTPIPGGSKTVNEILDQNAKRDAQVAKGDAGEITYKMASDAVLAVNKECGRDAALKLIQSVQDGASKLPEVDAGNWGKVVAGAKKLLDAKKAGVK